MPTPAQADLQTALHAYADAIREGAGSLTTENALDDVLHEISIPEREAEALRVSEAVEKAAAAPDHPDVVRAQMNDWVAALKRVGFTPSDPMITVRIYEALSEVEGEEDSL
jgi:hypothetical protein